jgi:hypothetical protein
MHKYIKIFLIMTLILFFINFSCSEETPDIPSPYEETQLIGYLSSDTCTIRLRQFSSEADVEIEVDEFDINITHRNAMFNCCLDSIRSEFARNGDTLKLTEVEYLTGGCYCTCPYEISATIGVCEPGTYLIEIFTAEFNKVAKLVYIESVEVQQ